MFTCFCFRLENRNVSENLSVIMKNFIAFISAMLSYSVNRKIKCVQICIRAQGQWWSIYFMDLKKPFYMNAVNWIRKTFYIFMWPRNNKSIWHEQEGSYMTDRNKWENNILHKTVSKVNLGLQCITALYLHSVSCARKVFIQNLNRLKDFYI